MKVCVFCGSSNKIEQSFLDETTLLGEIFAREGIECIYGGGSIGQMGALAKAMVKNNGSILGIIPRFMIERGWGNSEVTMRITQSMHERKATMTALSDVIVALPGGVGTFEELLEAITWKQLGLHDKPIFILNTNRYFDPLLNMFDSALDNRFIEEKDRHIWQIIDKATDLVPAIKKELKTTVVQ